ncbi:hypothetical protein EV183_002293 [Coemansia sp. RSA 2336]|nr:hypothetical protein EV183_002293 [Coemansia sp. RSA 2336]
MLSELEKLLAQVESESGRELVGSAAGGQQEPSSGHIRTGIDAIDADLGNIPRSFSQRVIELVGLPGSGKTQALYHICATVSTTSTHILYFNVDGKLDLRKLSQAIDRHSSKEALKRIHVFSPHSTVELVASLAMAPKYARERQISTSIIVVDSVGGNYWMDRKETACLRLKIKRATAWFRLQQLFVDTLQTVCQRLDCLAVVAHTLLLFGFDSTGKEHLERSFVVNGREYRDSMIPRWQTVLLASYLLEATACQETTTRVLFRNSKRSTADGQAFVGPSGFRNTKES